MRILDSYYNFLEKNRYRDIISLIESLTIAIIIALLIRQFVVSSFVIPTASMESTLIKGDFLIGTKYDWGAKIPFSNRRLPSFGKVHSDDVIIFQSSFPPYDDYIKRCVALPGDTIEYRNKEVFINDNKIAFTGSINKDPLLVSHRDNFGPYVIPKKGDMLYLDTNSIQSASFFINLIAQENPDTKIEIEHSFNVGGTIMKEIDLTTEKIIADEFAKDYYAFNILIIKLKKLNQKILNADISLITKVKLNGEYTTKYQTKSDSYFMLGDNRDYSIDSRYWGFVSYRSLRAKPMLILANLKLSGMFHGSRLHRIGHIK